MPDSYCPCSRLGHLQACQPTTHFLYDLNTGKPTGCHWPPKDLLVVWMVEALSSHGQRLCCLPPLDCPLSFQTHWKCFQWKPETNCWRREESEHQHFRHWRGWSGYKHVVSDDGRIKRIICRLRGKDHPNNPSPCELLNQWRNKEECSKVSALPSDLCQM